LPPGELAVCQDEVDITPNPKIGAMWMRRGPHVELPRPGTNEKHYLAGSLNWRSGALLVTVGFPKQDRTAALFIRHLDELRCRWRRYWKIHVIGDNARLHNCQAVQRYLRRWGHRLVLHYLVFSSPSAFPPCYGPL
jgi:putative transposase